LSVADFGLVVIVVVALAFDYTNGFHDAANAIALSVSTRALTPRVALFMAGSLNLVGALVSTSVAATVGKGIVDAPHGGHGMVLVFSALLGAIVWNLITWYFGLPSSSSHALIGGLIGSALITKQHFGAVKWSGVVEKVVVPMVLSPLIGFVLAFIVMLLILWVFQRGNAHRLNRNFRRLQRFSAAAIAYSHGTQDAQKTMGVITLALVTGGFIHEFSVPLWVKFAAAGAMALGTYSGGWRIMRTLGRRIVQVDPPRGFAADTTSSIVLLTAAHFGAPVSTTHTITSAVMGVGASKRFSAVRWGVAGNIVIAWVLTLPAAAAAAAAVHLILLPFFG
jgi:PiT family inorganic phosphate transporter